jgi:hypothetical protein
MLKSNSQDHANPSGSDKAKRLSHAQSIAGEHRIAEYNPATSHRHPTPKGRVKRYADLTGNRKKSGIKSPGDNKNTKGLTLCYCNQNVKVAKVFWMGALTYSNNRRQGLLDAITA